MVSIEESRRDAAFRILTSWGLNEPQSDQLLSNNENIIAVLSIHDSLRVILPEDQANLWPSKPNAAWDGASALDVMLAGDIERVRKHLKYHLYSA